MYSLSSIRIMTNKALKNLYLIIIDSKYLNVYKNFLTLLVFIKNIKNIIT